MSRIADEKRVAMLLSALGEDAIEPALAGVDAHRAQAIRAELERLAQTTVDHDEMEEVVDDFETFFRFAVQTLSIPTVLDDQIAGSVTGDGDEVSADESSGAQIRIFEPTDDPVEDLQRLEPAQIAGALASEHPKTIALVFGCLDRTLAAKTIDLLPSEAQSEVFFQLRDDHAAPDDLVQRIVRTTVDKGMKIEPTQLDEPDVEQKMAELLRELPKATRSRLVDELKVKDEETATRLQDLLYVFDDILLYDNRSIQKLLGQVDTAQLVTALQDAEDEIRERIFENLSKRARSALTDEMEFSARASEEEVEQSRKAIAQLISKMDQAGEINLLQ